MDRFILFSTKHNTRERIDVDDLRRFVVENHPQSTVDAILIMRQNKEDKASDPMGDIGQL